MAEQNQQPGEEPEPDPKDQSGTPKAEVEDEWTTGELPPADTRTNMLV